MRGFDDFVIVGHSSGGVLGYALASYLVDAGRPPLGVALLDSFVPGQVMRDGPVFLDSGLGGGCFDNGREAEGASS